MSLKPTSNFMLKRKKDKISINHSNSAFHRNCYIRLQGDRSILSVKTRNLIALITMNF